MVARATAIFLLTALLAMPALACGVMEKAEPRVGSTGPSPAAITLTFTQPFDPAQSNVSVTDVSGYPEKLGKPTASADNTVLTLTPAQPLPAGKYTVRWDVLWTDCDSKTQGDYKFTVK